MPSAQSKPAPEFGIRPDGPHVGEALPWWRRTVVVWAALFVIALALYAATACRSVQWQDPGGYILNVFCGQPYNRAGLALSHPIHHWIGRAAVGLGVGEPCFVVTLISALASAVTVANVFGCVRMLTRRMVGAMLAAASLAVAHVFWQNATRADCYTVSAALMSAELWCLAGYFCRQRPGYLCAALLFNGLGLSNHNLALLTTPVLAVLVVQGLARRRVTGPQAILAAGLWLLGALLYLGMFAALWISGGDFAAAARSALVGNFAPRMFHTADPLRLLLLSIGCVGFNFPNLLLPAAVWGFWRAPRLGVPSPARWTLLAYLVLHLGFAGRYDVPDQYLFFVPTCVVLALFGGIGFTVLIERNGQLRRARLGLVVALVALTPVFYAIAVPVARHYDALRPVARNKPYRDEYVYVMVPWSIAERSADRMSRDAIELARDDGLIIVEDATVAPAVVYVVMRTPGHRPTVLPPPATEAIEQTFPWGKGVVLVPMDKDNPTTDAPMGKWERNGDLYVLTPD